MQLVQLADLALRAPAMVGGPGIAKVETRDFIETARRVETVRKLVGQRLDVDKAMVLCRTNGLFVKGHRLALPTLGPGDLGADQCRTTLEVFGAIRRPRIDSPVMGEQGFGVLTSPLGRCGSLGGCFTKRAVEIVICRLEHGGRSRQKRLRFRRRR